MKQKFCSFFMLLMSCCEAISTLSIRCILFSERLQLLKADPYWKVHLSSCPGSEIPLGPTRLHRLFLSLMTPSWDAPPMFSGPPWNPRFNTAWSNTQAAPLSHLGSTPQTEQPLLIDIFSTTLVLWYFPLGFNSHHNIIPHLSSPMWTDSLPESAQHPHQGPSCTDIPP